MGRQALKLTSVTMTQTGAPDLNAIVNDGPCVKIADLDLGDARINAFKKHDRIYRSVKNVGVTRNARRQSLSASASSPSRSSASTTMA